MTPFHVRRRTSRVLGTVGTLTCVWLLTILVVASAVTGKGVANDER